MARRNDPTSEIVAMRNTIISDYVRLSLGGELRPGEVYRKLERRLKSFKKLENPADEMS